MAHSGNNSSTLLDVSSLPWVFNPIVTLLNITNDMCYSIGSGEIHNNPLGYLTSVVFQLFEVTSSLLMILLPTSMLLSVLLTIPLTLALPVAMYYKNKRIEKGCVLEIDLQQGLIIKEALPEDPLMRKVMNENTMTIWELVNVLDKASKDDRIEGLVCYLGGGAFVQQLGLGGIQEIRDAIIQFQKEKGKFTYCYANSFGEGQNGTFAYYFATSFEKIFIQPSGEVGIAGMLIEHPFIKRVLEKWGLVAHLEHRKAYKNMKNLFTETEFTKEHKEATQAILDNVIEEIKQVIHERRGIDMEVLNEAMNNAPLSANKAKELNLVDDLIYRHKFHKLVDELSNVKAKNMLFIQQYMKKQEEKVPELPLKLHLAIKKYLPFISKKYFNQTKVALIYVCGSIFTGKGVTGQSSGCDNICKAIQDACDDERVGAILLRVDSGGGSYVASDMICSMVEEAIRVYKKPVVVSMGNAAASGGYFVSCKANSIVCQPLTFTGSIGVVYGKFGTEEFWKQMSVDWDDINSHDNASLYTGRYGYNEKQMEKVNLFLDDIYEDFKKNVAEGRGFDDEAMEKIAQGRVWVGKDACNIGLVDKLGGFNTALSLVRDHLNLNADAPIKLTQYPVWSLKTLLGGTKHSRDVSYGSAGFGLNIVQWSVAYIRSLFTTGLQANNGAMALESVPTFQ